MLSGGSFKDENIVSRSFRFISPSVGSPENVLQFVDYDIETSFFSTAVGDNRYINPLPGFGYNTDPCPDMVKLNGVTQNEFIPMGRYYNRIYDRNATLLTLTAGVPEFSGILRFLSNSFDYAASLVTNKGRTPSLAFYISAAVTSIAFYPLQLIGVGITFLSFLNDTPRNQWYYVKPAMGQYLAAAQGIYNDLLTGAGYILPVLTDRSLLPSHQGEKETHRNGDAEVTQGKLNMFYPGEDSGDAQAAAYKYTNRLYPSAVNEDGTIDIGKLITRGTRKYRYYLGAIKELDKNIKGELSDADRQDKIREIGQAFASNAGYRSGTGLPTRDLSTSDYLSRELATVGKYRGTEEISSPELASAYYDPAIQAEIRPSGAQYATNQGATASETWSKVESKVTAAGNYNGSTVKLSNSTSAQNNTSLGSKEDTSGWLNTVGTLLRDSFYGGFDAVTFRVEGGVGPVGDSFSNSTQQSEIAGFFNGTVSAINNFKFNIQGGKTGFDPIDAVMSRVTDTLAGFAQGSVIGSPILAALGNSRLIIPEHWADSATNLHTESFQIKCNALYATSYSISTQIYLPLALILPFVLPVCTGGSTYTTPFMCKAFSQGRTIIKTGIVKNASITFGEGELGWTRDRKPLNMTINLEIADLDPICSAPVSRIKNPLEIFDPNSTVGKYLGDVGKYNDYVARVTGRDYLDTVLVYNRLNRSLTSFRNDFKELFSPTRVAGIFNDSIVGDVTSAIWARPLNR